MAAADEAPPRMMKRLPQEEVSWILARDRMPTGGLTEFEALEDELEELLTWVRAEYGSKGFVEVDHPFVSGRVRREKKIAEIWEKCIGRVEAYLESRLVAEEEFTDFGFPGCYCDVVPFWCCNLQRFNFYVGFLSMTGMRIFRCRSRPL